LSHASPVNLTEILSLPIEVKRELLPLLDEKARRDELRALQAERQRRHNNAESIRARCRTLTGFIKEAWHVLEPSNPYIHGWHVEAIAEHLEAITRGELRRLIINIPPRHMKSLTVSDMA